MVLKLCMRFLFSHLLTKDLNGLTTNCPGTWPSTLSGAKNAQARLNTPSICLL